MNKKEIRKNILEKRKKFYLNRSFFFKKKLMKLFKKIPKNKVVGAYYPFNYEVDILETLSLLEKLTFKISLPKIKKNNQMNFYSWTFKEPMSINKHGIPEPVSEKIKYPDVLLIPLVAFDNNLNRLGYGGGYYDRYLSKLKKKKNIMKIGIAFSFQKIKKIPINNYDIKLDYVLTEKKLYS